MSDPQQTFSWRTVLPIVLETMRDATLVSYPEIFERVQKIAASGLSRASSPAAQK